MTVSLSPTLNAALAAVRIDPTALTATVGGRRIEAGSLAALRTELSRTLYDVLHAGRRPPTGHGSTRDPALERQLAAATPHATTRAVARLVRAVGPGGRPIVELDGVRVRLPATASHPADRPVCGAFVAIETDCVRPRLSPGHFLVDGSQGNGLAAGPVLRVYLHLTGAAAAAPVWRRVRHRLEQLNAPYRAKIGSRPAMFPRRDAMVVYLGPSAWQATGLIVSEVAGLPGIGREVSPFARELAPGVAVAWEPADDRPSHQGSSFGQHRAGAIGAGLIDHVTGRTPGSRADAVAAALIDAGIDPTNPFRNLTSPPLPVE
jgi:hypothetical protein